MAILGGMGASVPLSEASSEAKEKMRKQREDEALQKSKTQGSRAKEEERRQKARERKIAESNYLEDFSDDEGDKEPSRKIRWAARPPGAPVAAVGRESFFLIRALAGTMPRPTQPQTFQTRLDFRSACTTGGTTMAPSTSGDRIPYARPRPCTSHTP